MANKYKLRCVKEDSVHFAEGLRYRVEAVRSFGDVKVGDVGGYVCHERNLDQTGTCWIYDEASVEGEAFVSDNAKVRHRATVKGQCVISESAEVRDFAVVSGTAKIMENAKVTDYAEVEEGAIMTEDAVISENAILRGEAVMKGDATAKGSAIIEGNALLADFSVAKDKAYVGEYAELVDYSRVEHRGVVKGKMKLVGTAAVMDDARAIGRCTLSGVIGDRFNLEKDRDSVYLRTSIGVSFTLNFLKDGKAHIAYNHFYGPLDEFNIPGSEVPLIKKMANALHELKITMKPKGEE